jgi:hypothetical protein
MVKHKQKISILLFIIISWLATGFGQVREPVVAGQFYPGSASRLKRTCQHYLQKAGTPGLDSKPFGIIVPHAGYVYSGRIAGISFNEIKNHDYDAIVILAPSHTQSFGFASIYEGQYYKTPLGKVPVDQKLAQEIASSSRHIKLSSKGHINNSMGRGEHSIEVELPFIQTIKPDIPIVPIVIGTLDYGVITEMGDILGEIAGEENLLIVASSDLSHYHSYSEAQEIDQRLIKALEKFNPRHFYQGIRKKRYEACGAAPITAMLIAGKQAEADKVKILEYANSGDIERASKSRVVGYLSAALVKEENIKQEQSNNKEEKSMDNPEQAQLNHEQKTFLLELAEKTVEAAVKGQPKPEPDDIPEIAKQERGAFVTLEKNGNLRGCIGQVIPSNPLWETVRDMAVSAALKDPRFPGVQEKELDDITVEISILTVPRKIDDIEEIEVGKHGIIIKRGYQQGLLLPQVATDQGWDRRTFIMHTCRKAGLPKDAWQDDSTEIKIFSAQVFSREDL